MPLKDLAEFALSSKEIMVARHTGHPAKPFSKADPHILHVSRSTASFQIRVRVEVSSQEHTSTLGLWEKPTNCQSAKFTTHHLSDQTPLLDGHILAITRLEIPHQDERLQIRREA